MKGLILALLFTGFFLLFGELKALKHIAGTLRKTCSGMNAASRQRSLADRQKLLSVQEKHSRWYAMEQRLQYCGVKSRFPGITAEWWLLGNLGAASALFTAVSILGGPGPGAAAVILWGAVESMLLRRLRKINLRRTEVKSALDTCCYEAATTGDVSMALLAMQERIEHPKFKELTRNIEVSVRYCADFSVLVGSSRRSLREYLKVAQERKGMLREAAVNLGLLAGMSAVVLYIVGTFTESGWAL